MAVRIDRFCWRIFDNRHFFRHTINGGGTAEDQFIDAGFVHSLQEVQRSANVVVVIFERGLNRFGDFDESGKVHNRIDVKIFERLDKQLVIVKVSVDKSGVFDGGSVAFAEVIENNGLMTDVREHRGHVAAYVPGAAAN